MGSDLVDAVVGLAVVDAFVGRRGRTTTTRTTRRKGKRTVTTTTRTSRGRGLFSNW